MSLSNYVKFGYVNGRPFLLGYKRREMLTSALRVLVKNPIRESFDITFIGNEKSCQNINQYLPIKNEKGN